MTEPVDGNCNVKICRECGVNIYALSGLRHSQEQYSRLGDYCVQGRLFHGHTGSHTDSVIREIERLTAEVQRLKHNEWHWREAFEEEGWDSSAMMAAECVLGDECPGLESTPSGKQCPHTPEVLEKGGMTCPDCGFYVEPYTIDDSSQESKST